MKQASLKILCLAMCLILCLGVLFSCGDAPAENTDTQVEATTSIISDSTTAIPVETTEALAELEVKTLGGEINIYWPEVHTDGHFVHNEIDCDQENGDSIDSAVFARNLRVEEKYGVTINSTLAFCSTIPKNIRTYWKAGDAPYDAFCTSISFLTDVAVEGVCADFNDMAYYSEDQQWWDHDLMNEFAIGGHKYWGLGDIIFSDNFYPYTVFINMGMYEDYKFQDDIFKLVENREWTVDKMMEMCKVVPNSTDDVWNYEDTYGILVNVNMARALYFGAGKTTTEYNADGEVTWVMNVENTQTIAEIAKKLFHSEHMAYDTDDEIGHNIPGKTHAQTAISMFANNQSLFYAEELIVTERMTKTESTIKYSLLPIPLVLEDNKDYKCVMNSAVCVCVPENVDTERISLVLSAMGRESVDTLTPAFFGIVLNYKYVSDAKSQEMLQLILDSAVPLDIGAIYNWGSLMSQYKGMVQRNSGDFASLYASAIRTINTDIKNFNKKLKGN